MDKATTTSAPAGFMSMISVLRRAAAPALERIRRNGRVVHWLGPHQRFGNQLFSAYFAHTDEPSAAGSVVLYHPHHGISVDIFPEMRRRLFIERCDVRLTDRRVLPTQNPWTINWELMTDFLNTYVINSPLFARPFPTIDHSTLVINVRRGDYYSVPHIAREYAYCVEEYVTEAVSRSISLSGMPSRMLFVSDDIEWCRHNLAPILPSGSEISFVTGSDATTDFLTVARAKRVIIPNSTFSMWAAYIGTALHEDHEVYVPKFHSRNEQNGGAYHWLPTWNIIESIPHGWDYVPHEDFNL